MHARNLSWGRAAVVAAALLAATSHAAAAQPATVDGPDGPYVPVDVQAWADPTDGREVVYINVPEGACVTVDHDARQVLFVYDGTCK